MMQPYMYILFWLITSHNLHSEKRPPPGLVAKMPVPSPTKRAVPDAAVVERLFRPLANYPVVGAVWQFKHGDVGTKVWGFQLVLCLGLSNTTVPPKFPSVDYHFRAYNGHY